jgi:hypothetical protein
MNKKLCLSYEEGKSAHVHLSFVDPTTVEGLDHQNRFEENWG